MEQRNPSLEQCQSERGGDWGEGALKVMQGDVGGWRGSEGVEGVDGGKQVRGRDKEGRVKERRDGRKMGLGFPHNPGMLPCSIADVLPYYLGEQLIYPSESELVLFWDCGKLATKQAILQGHKEYFQFIGHPAHNVTDLGVGVQTN